MVHTSGLVQTYFKRASSPIFFSAEGAKLQSVCDEGKLLDLPLHTTYTLVALDIANGQKCNSCGPRDISAAVLFLARNRVA